MTDPDWLKPIVEAEKAATEGPWWDECGVIHNQHDAGDGPHICVMRPGNLYNNAAFITLMRTKAPDLLAMLRLLAEANAALLETWKHAGPQGSGQMEKFDHAIRLARIADDAYRTGVLPKGD